jgi:hypothetical protein
VKKGGGKAKGAAWERECCKHLSLWVSDGKNEDLFWRSAMSGGRATVALAKGKRLAAQAGDITCISTLGRALTDMYFIECKHYRDLDLRGVFTGKGKLCEFWDEVNKQAAQYDKSPMLIAKQNNLPAFVCIKWPGWWSDFSFLHVSPLSMSILWFGKLLTMTPPK